MQTQPQPQQKDDNTILLSRENFTRGQYHFIEVLAKTLDENVEYKYLAISLKNNRKN